MKEGQIIDVIPTASQDGMISLIEQDADKTIVTTYSYPRRGNTDFEIIYRRVEEGEQNLVGKTAFVNASAGLRVRSTPSVDGERIGALDYLTELKVVNIGSGNVMIDGVRGRWVKIIADNIEGWVFDGYLTELLDDR